MTVLAKTGHPAKISDMPFLVLFDSAEFCAHHIFVLFMRQSTETQWPPIRRPGNSKFENGSNEKYSIYAVCLRLRNNCLCTYLHGHAVTVLSPILFLLVMDPLLQELRQISCGPSVCGLYLGAFSHADIISYFCLIYAAKH